MHNLKARAQARRKGVRVRRSKLSLVLGRDVLDWFKQIGRAHV